MVADVTRNEGLFSCDMQRKLPPRIVAHNSTVHDRGMQNKSISRSLISLSLSIRVQLRLRRRRNNARDIVELLTRRAQCARKRVRASPARLLLEEILA